MVKKQIAGSVGKIVLFIALILVFLAGIYFIYVYSFSPASTPSPSLNGSTSTTDDSKCPNLLVKKGTKLYMYNTSAPEELGKNPILFDSLDDYIYYVKVQRTQYNNHCPILFLQQETTTQGDEVYRVRPGPFDLEAGTQTPIVASPTQIAAVRNYFSNSNGSISSGMIPPTSNIIGPSSSVQGYSSGSGSFSSNQSSIPLINAQGPPMIHGGTGVPLPVPPLPQSNPVPYIDANRDNPPYNSNEYSGFDPYGQYQGVFTTIDAIHKQTRTDTTNGYSDNAMDPNWGGVLFTTSQVASGKYDDNIVSKPVYSGTPNVYTNPGLLLPTTALPASSQAVQNYSTESASNFIINPQVDSTNNIQNMNYNYSASSAGAPIGTFGPSISYPTQKYDNGDNSDTSKHHRSSYNQHNKTTPVSSNTTEPEKHDKSSKHKRNPTASSTTTPGSSFSPTASSATTPASSFSPTASSATTPASSFSPTASSATTPASSFSPTASSATTKGSSDDKKHEKR
jgi:hypothetical protein